MSPEISSSSSVPRPKVIFFDVNETLLDLGSMKTSVAKALGGRDDLLPLWFSSMLHHSLVDTLTERYHGFAEIGTASLLMLAQNHGIEISEEQAREAIVLPLQSLPAHPDVEAGLRSLKEQGFRLISFSNSSQEGVTSQFKEAGLIEFFEQVLSVEDQKIYKPALASYRWAMAQAKVKPEEAMMVAAHGWDIAGVKASGMTGVLSPAPAKASIPLPSPPTRKSRPSPSSPNGQRLFLESQVYRLLTRCQLLAARFLFSFKNLAVFGHHFDLNGTEGGIVLFGDKAELPELLTVFPNRAVDGSLGLIWQINRYLEITILSFRADLKRSPIIANAIQFSIKAKHQFFPRGIDDSHRAPRKGAPIIFQKNRTQPGRRRLVREREEEEDA